MVTYPPRVAILTSNVLTDITTMYSYSFFLYRFEFWIAKVSRKLAIAVIILRSVTENLEGS
jgi:hypothetical protein